MAILEKYMKERTFPFVFVVAVLVICVALLLVFTNDSTRFGYLSAQNLGTASNADDHHLQEIKRSPFLVHPLPTESNEELRSNWSLCKSADYIPCLDNSKAIKELKSRRHMEHRERHCPNPAPLCLVPLPPGYKIPLPWPASRDKIWFDNAPHPKLVEYKKDQNWVRRSGDYLIFPGGGTQFKDGVTNYIEFIEKTLPSIKWGKHIRVVLDVGCGVASFGGYLLDKDVITMSFAPKDEHEAQIQFALERGIPAILSVIGTQRLPFPDNVYDLVHCARCRVHWDADGGKPLLELNRIIRPGGFFIWSATPVYRDDSRDLDVWNAMVALTQSMCWKVVSKATDSVGIGVVIYQKPVSNSCYEERSINNPPLCDETHTVNKMSWYTQLESCLPQLPWDSSVPGYNWPKPWPERLNSKPSWLLEASGSGYANVHFNEDNNCWTELVSNVYLRDLAINWSSIRNVMDMNAAYGGFAAALIDQPLWVMNTVPVNGLDTLRIIFERGLVGIYHDWCESFNTYPRTYDLLHADYLFGNLSRRCDMVDVAVEMDRILRPGGWVLVHDNVAIIKEVLPIMGSLHWDTTLYTEGFLVGKKGQWRPMAEGSLT